MKRKKLFCMVLSIVMAITTMDFPAAASEALTETTNVSEETSAEQESTTIQQETTKETETEQESVRNTIGETESETEESIALNPTETTEIETEETTNSTTEKTTENETEKVTETITEEATEVQTEKTTETETEETTTLEEETEKTTALETETEEVTETTTEETTDSKQQDTKLQVSYHTTDEILAFLEQENAVKTDKITYKEQPSVTAPYKAGSLSSETLDSAVAMIRQIRFIAGLPYDISLNKDYNDLSQSAALVNYINNELSHEPSKPDDISEKLFQQSYEGASNSNIAFDSNQKKTLNETLISSWMADKDSENISQLENRSKILNPSMEQVGFGAVTGSQGIYSAMYTADCSGESENTFGVAWPAQNMPIEYFGSDYPWSVSTNETLKASEIGVTLTRKSDGKEWNFSKDSADGDFYVYSDNSAQKSNIIFRPETSDIIAYEDEDSFQVEISKNKKPYISYTVHFFSIAEEKEILTSPEASISSGEVVAKESKLILTSEEDAAIYYTLDGTTPSTESTLYTEPISIDEDITVKALAVKEGYTDSDIAEFIYTVVEDAPLRYNITFESNGGTIVPAQSILENEKIEQPETPVKEGYLLEGWFKEAECENIWDFEKDTVTADITLYAKWTEDPSAAVYTVSFELQGHGTPIESLTVKTGELLTAPETPTAEGYHFEGWFKEPECTNAWNFTVDTILSNTILYAKWAEGEAATETTDSANTCLVTFDMQGIGTQIEPITINNGETFAAPNAPTADGYTFAEWYREAEYTNAWDFDADIVTEDIVLYAKWIPDDAEISMGASKETKEEDTRIDLGLESAQLKTNNIKPRRYNGKPYEPSITVSIFNGKKRVTLKKDRDYTLTYRNNVNPSEKAAAILKGIGNYKGQKTIYFTIEPPINLKEAETKISDIKPKRYNGTPYEPSVTVTASNGKKRVTLKKDRDYTLTYKDNSNTGTEEKEATAVITGKGEYTGTVEQKFIVLPQIDLTAASISNIKPRVYNGKAYEPNISVSILSGNKQVTLKKGRDYKLTYKDNINASTEKIQPSVTITGIGEYKGSRTENFTITPKDIKKLKIVTDSMCVGSTAADIYAFDGTTYVSWQNYTVNYNVNPENPKDVTADITANKNTNYTGTVRVKFNVYDVPSEKLIDRNSVPSNYGSAVYTGKPITRNITAVKAKDGTELIPNKDYSVKYQNNINVGKATVTITGKGKFKGKVVRTFDIKSANISNEEQITITSNISPKTYNGKEQKPTTITLKTVENKKLALNKDYTLTYSNNIHSGIATITINGINNCIGSINTTFKIKPQDIKKVSVSATKKTEENPTSKVVLKYNKKELQEYADYIITNYEESGTKVKVTLKGLADFEGQITKTLKTDIPEPEPTESALASSNLNKHNYLNFTAHGLEVSSHLFQNDDGTLTRVEYIGGKGVVVEEYTADYQFIRQKKLIKPELPIYGGFYATKDNYFLVFGQKNPNNDNNVEVIRFVKYNKNWERQEDARLFGANTAEPFIFSSVRMVDHEGVLYVRTGHNMYNGHQANMAFSINIEDMTFINQFYTLGGPSIASHSLNQFITMDEPYLITADHGDAYPRGILLARHVKAGDKNTYFTSKNAAYTITALKVGGAEGSTSNVTGASVTGLEASDTSYLVVGRSVDPTPGASYNPSGILNIYVSSTPKDNFTNEAVKVHWITDFKYIEYTDENGNPQKTPEASITNPQLVKLNGNEMILMWSQTTTVVEDNKPVIENGKIKTTSSLKSMLLNENGEPISGIYSFEGGLSDCEPILINGNLVWYYTSKSTPTFCILNPEDVRKQPR